MKVKMTNELKKLYSNLGLPENVLNSVAGMAIVGLATDADDAAIAARASESYVSDMLKSFQSHTDKIRTDAQKAADEKNKGEKHDGTGAEGDMPAWAKQLLESQKNQQEAMQKEIDALKGQATQRTFDTMVASVAKELKLEGAVLDLCKAGLSADMDETAVRNKLGAAKKTLIDNGAHFEEKTPDMTATQEAAERKAAQEWAKSQAEAIAKQSV